MAGPLYALTNNHKVKRSKVDRVMRCAAGMGLHVDTTAQVSTVVQSVQYEHYLMILWLLHICYYGQSLLTAQNMCDL